VPLAALPQLPLTLLNSVIAVAALAADLFPKEKPSVRSISISVGLMNLIGGFFGAMPMCHGAGGLAGQYRFGARTNGSILMLGAAKLLAALLFGASLIALCGAFPLSLLGVMLVFSGLELAIVVRDQNERSAVFAMLVTAGVSLGLNNIALGTAAGLLVAWLGKLTFIQEEKS
jgi:MFS superfamily sulfate permease-like transporter